MVKPRVLILRGPGTNCDEETAFAFEKAGARAARVHINRLLENQRLLEEYQILCIPGGFSYGDDIAAGKILANRIAHHLSEAWQAFHEAGKLILGICNGFQVLLKAGMLLPQEGPMGPPATLAWNDSGRFEDRWTRLKVVGNRCVFLQGLDELYLPVAHAEGKFVARDQATLEHLDEGGYLVLRYRKSDGSSCEDWSKPIPYPDNPNGSMANVAGVCDGSGRIFGLMPHPERHIDPTQHPRWTRGEAGPTGDGMYIFLNAVRFFS